MTNTNNPFDDFGHGTHVAGTVAATGDNNIGVVGVNWRTQVMPVKVLNSSGAGATSSLASGIEYAYKHGARVANVSIQSIPGDAPPIAIQTQIQNAAVQTFPGQGAGMIYVAAAGNDATNIDSVPVYPASFPEENILSVAATDINGNRPSFSNYMTVS